MVQHFMTVCVFCLLCATHTPCSAHTDLVEDRRGTVKFNDGLNDPNRSNVRKLPPPLTVEHSDNSDNNGVNNRLNLLKNNYLQLNKKSNYAEEENELYLRKLANDQKHHDMLHHRNNRDYLRGDLDLSFTDVKVSRDARYETENGDQKVVKVSRDARYKKENGGQEVKVSRDARYKTENGGQEVVESGKVTEKENKKNNKKFSRGNKFRDVNGYRRSKRHAPKYVIDDQYYIQELFNMFGDGEKLTLENFENLTRHLYLDRMSEKKQPAVSKNENTANRKKSYPNDNFTCISSRELLESFDHKSESHRHTTDSTDVSVSPSLLRKICPMLIYQLTVQNSTQRQGCVFPPEMMFREHKTSQHSVGDKQRQDNIGAVWLYSSLAIFAISACGLLGVAVIPVMQKHFYHQLLQFLVALAVGTLSGDALLHLLPHAMMPHDAHSHDSHDDHAAHDVNMWKGFVAMIGLIFFFFTEKFLMIGAEWRKRRQKKSKLPARVRVMRDNDSVGNNSVGEKLCKHKYSSYPYCYDEIATETQDDHHNRNLNNKKIENRSIDSRNNTTTTTTTTTLNCDDAAESDCETASLHKSCSYHSHGHETNQNDLTAASRNRTLNDQKNIIVENNETVISDYNLPRNNLQLGEEESYTVILREHENKHHGHSHTHGHVHSAPSDMSSVAWMVIMGDGLHNFTDGMAIGAAFAAGIAGGFSTSVAVFCHELPHEIGDFAVLLKAGMSAKQAVFYNILSSILCLFGMITGVLLGHNESASSWIFAIAAGMFLYIALVDMIPELTTSHSNEGGSLLQCLLQFLGLMAGLGIMTLIAIYEHDLKTIFNNSYNN